VLYEGFGSINANAIVVSSPNAIWSGKGAITANATVTALGRRLGEEWSNIAAGSEIWTNITTGSETWTDITGSSNTWLPNE